MALTGSTARVFVPGDAAAVSVGADEVAAAVEAAGAQVVRNGSRGMLWLEPLVEVETPRGRIAYGPVSAADVSSLFDAGFLTGGLHPTSQGLTDDIPFFKNQERLTFARVGVTDPLSLADYEAHGGWAGLRRALSLSPAEVVEGWMNSPGHRANILKPAFTHIGVGFAGGGPAGTYWTQLFGG